MKYRNYRIYKDSGIEWIGEVPIDWNLIRLKYIAHVNMGQSPDSSETNKDRIGIPFLQGCSDFGKFHPNPISYCQYPPKSANLGDILLSVRAPVGALNVADTQYGIGRGLCSITPFCEPGFLFYSLEAGKAKLASISTGSTFEAVTISDVANFEFVIPSLEEQHSIASFLDKEIHKLDALINRHVELIALLKEKQSALITHAVTKGLDANAKMKASGVKWLSELPEGWEVCKLKHLVDVTDGTHDTPSYVTEGFNTYPLVTSQHIVDGVILIVEANHISATDYMNIEKRSKVEKYDIIMPMIGTIGNPAIVITDTHFAIKNLSLFKTSRSKFLIPSYLQYLLRSHIIDFQLRFLSRGGVQDFVALDTLRNLTIPKITIEEQEAISCYLDDVTTRIDKLILHNIRILELFKERRSALITAAVTGKIDVRDEVPA